MQIEIIYIFCVYSLKKLSNTIEFICCVILHFDRKLRVKNGKIQFVFAKQILQNGIKSNLGFQKIDGCTIVK